MKRKLLPLTFLIIIFLFGAATVYKSAGGVLELLRSEEISTKTSSEIEAVLQDKMYRRNNWIDVHGLTQRVLGRTVVEDSSVNTVYKMDSGSITLVETKKSKEKLGKFAKRMNKLKNNINGTDLIYVQLPYKAGGSEGLPVGVKSYADRNADKLIDGLEEYDIDVLDTRDYLKKKAPEVGIEWTDMFYVTDHHWRPQTACMAADKISSYLAETRGYNYDASLFAPESMDTETFYELFLGSVGRRTGSLYAGIDDFELVTPSYETSFDFTSYPEGDVIHREGSFREALIDDANLQKDYYNINNYASYTGDSTKLTRTINTGDPINDKKILLIRDSYSCALQPFLSLGLKDITTIDLRYFKDEAVIDHINKNDYDLVIVAYTPMSLDFLRFTFDKIPE